MASLFLFLVTSHKYGDETLKRLLFPPSKRCFIVFAHIGQDFHLELNALIKRITLISLVGARITAASVIHHCCP